MKHTNFIKSVMIDGYFIDEPQKKFTIQFYETEIFVWNKYITPIVRKTTIDEVKSQNGFGLIEMRDFEKYFKISRSLAKRNFFIETICLGNSDTYFDFNGHPSKNCPNYDSLEGYEKLFIFSDFQQERIDKYATRGQFYQYLQYTYNLDAEIFKKEHEKLKATPMGYSDWKYQRFCKIRRIIPYGLARIHSKPLQIKETVKGDCKLAIFPQVLKDS